MGWLTWVVGWMPLAVFGFSGLGCSQPRPGESASSRAAADRSAAVLAPPPLAAYCADVGRRRAAFHPQLRFELRAASLTAREGYEPRALSAAEQALFGAPQPQLFLGGAAAVSAADLGAVSVQPSWRDGGRFDVMMSAKSVAAIAPRLQPLVGAAIAVFVDGILIEFADLEGAGVRQFPIAIAIGQTEATDLAARLGPPLDVAALQSLETRCLDGDRPLCRLLAEERLLGRDVPYNPEEARVLFEIGCHLADGRACTRGGEVAIRPEHKTELLERACQLKEADACLALANGLLESDRPADDRARGKALLTRSCDLGGGKACAELAERLGKAWGDAPRCASSSCAESPEQVQALVKLLERACGGADADSCFTLGQFAQRGSVGAADPASAKRWLRAGCALDRSGGVLGFRGLSAELRAVGCSDEPTVPSPSMFLCDHPALANKR